MQATSPQNTYGLEAADLDGDGAPELLAAGGGEFSVVRRLPSGELAELEAVRHHHQATGLAAGDLDADGDLDVGLSGRAFDTALLYANRGDGRFEAPFTLDLNLACSSLVLADLDGDGRVDLAGGASAPGQVVFVRNSTLPAAGDCNRNAVPDECDLRDRTSVDRLGDGMPDECQSVPFHRGDADDTGATNLSDARTVLAFVLTAGPAPTCLAAADANGDGRVDISDGIYLLGFLFRQGPPPAAPGAAETDACGLPPLGKGSKRFLGCESYVSCAGG